MMTHWGNRRRMDLGVGDDGGSSAVRRRWRRKGGGADSRPIHGSIHDQPANLFVIHLGRQLRIYDAIKLCKKNLLATAAVVRHAKATLT